MNHKSFLFVGAWMQPLRALPLQQRWNVMEAIVEYSTSGSISTSLDTMETVAFGFIRNEIDRMKHHRNEACMKRHPAVNDHRNETCRKRHPAANDHHNEACRKRHPAANDHHNETCRKRHPAANDHRVETCSKRQTTASDSREKRLPTAMQTGHVKTPEDSDAKACKALHPDAPYDIESVSESVSISESDETTSSTSSGVRARGGFCAGESCRLRCHLPIQKWEKMELRRSGVVMAPVREERAAVASRMSMAMKSALEPACICPSARRNASPALSRSP